MPTGHNTPGISLLESRNRVVLLFAALILCFPHVFAPQSGAERFTKPLQELGYALVNWPSNPPPCAVTLAVLQSGLSSPDSVNAKKFTSFQRASPFCGNKHLRLRINIAFITSPGLRNSRLKIFRQGRGLAHATAG